MTKISQIDFLIDRAITILRLDLLYFIPNSIYTGLGQISLGLSTLFISIFLTNNLGLENFGKYQYLLSVIGVLSFISLQGMDIVLIRAVRTYSDLSKILIVLFKHKFIGSLILSIILIIIGQYYHTKLNKEFTLFFWLVGLFIPFYFSSSLYETYLTATYKFKRLGIYKALSSLLIAVSVVIVSFITRNFAISALVYFIVGALLNLFFFMNCHGQKFWFSRLKMTSSLPQAARFPSCSRAIKERSKNFSNSSSLKLVKEGYFFSFLSLAGVSATFLDKIILGNLLGFKEVAIYTLASFLPFYILNNTKIFMTIAGVKLLHEEEAKSIVHIRNHLRKIFFLGLLLAICGIIFSPFFINLFFPGVGSNTGLYSQILSIFLILAPVNALLAHVLIYQKGVRENISLFFIPAVPKIVLFLILIPVFKIYGVIFAHLISTVIFFTWLNTKLKLFKAKSS